MAFDEDSRLARKVQKGDRRAFELILTKYEKQIYSFVYHFFRDHDLCEDLTQETFLRAYRFIGSFRPKDKLSTWLFSIARNLCIDEYRRSRKGTLVDIDAVDPEELAAEIPCAGNPLHTAVVAQEGEILRRQLVKLPEKYRTCLILFYFNELSYEEIAGVMKISLSNTKILLFRGKKMLLDLCRGDLDEKL